jgi:nucleotide-binding universal stress UspA family protein
MKTILVPVDFSDVSENALKYTLSLNQTLNAPIVLFHAYRMPVYATDIPVIMPDPELKDEMQQHLDKWKRRCEISNPDMIFKSHLTEGLSWDEIIKEEKNVKADLIVLGINEAKGLERIFGSNASEILKRSDCPVLTIPLSTMFRKIKKIVFATNYSENDFENIYAAIEYAQLFDARVTLLHITDPDINRTVQYNELEAFRNHIEQESQYLKLDHKLIDAPDPVDGINYFIEETNADLLAVSMRKLSAFKRIFNKSLTKEMVYHTHIPMMAFHSEY